jgi:Lipoprotein amino terminal region
MISQKTTSPTSRSYPKRKCLVTISGLLLALSVPTTLVYGKQLGQLPTSFTAMLSGQSGIAPAYKFNVGQQLVYKLDYRNSASSDLRALFSDLKKSGDTNTNSTAPNSFVSAFENHVQADLVMTIVTQRPGGWLVSYQLRNPIVQINASGQEIKEQAQLVQQDLRQEILATIDPQGKILTLRFAPNTSKIAQSFARTVFAALQFVTPATSGSSGSWETQEEDPNGQYTAQYTARSGKFQKTKLRYRQPERNSPNNHSQITPVITSDGQLTAELDRGSGRLTTLQGQENQSFEVSKKLVGQAKTNLQLTYTSQSQLTETALRTLYDRSAQREAQSPAVRLSQALSEPESNAKIQRQALGESTLETLLVELDAAEKAADKTQNVTPLYLKFKALVYLQPQTSNALAQRLINSPTDSLSMQMLVGALSAIGHEPAQVALVQIMQDHAQDWQTALLIIPSLAAVPAPTPTTVTALNQFAFASPDQRVASTAQLALGAIARNLAEPAPDRANAIVDRFIQNLMTAKSNEAIKQNLLVLGNAGSPRSLDAITKFVTSPEAEIRSIAVVALRWIIDPPADRLLNQTIKQDSDDNVRAETAVALGFRTMTPENLAIQKQVLAADQSAKVRLALLKNLWQVREQFPEVTTIVQQLAQTDPDSDLRTTANSLLTEDKP